MRVHGVDVPNTTPDWDLQLQLPDDTWQTMNTLQTTKLIVLNRTTTHRICLQGVTVSIAIIRLQAIIHPSVCTGVTYRWACKMLHSFNHGLQRSLKRR